MLTEREFDIAFEFNVLVSHLFTGNAPVYETSVSSKLQNPYGKDLPEDENMFFMLPAFKLISMESELTQSNAVLNFDMIQVTGVVVIAYITGVADAC